MQTEALASLAEQIVAVPHYRQYEIAPSLLYIGHPLGITAKQAHTRLSHPHAGFNMAAPCMPTTSGCMRSMKARGVFDRGRFPITDGAVGALDAWAVHLCWGMLPQIVIPRPLPIEIEILVDEDRLAYDSPASLVVSWLFDLTPDQSEALFFPEKRRRRAIKPEQAAAAIHRLVDGAPLAALYPKRRYTKKGAG